MSSTGGTVPRPARAERAPESPDPGDARRLKIMFLMRSMQVGGAERQLCVLARELRRKAHDVSVLLYYAGGQLDAELLAAGVRIVDLAKRGRWDLGFVRRLIRAVHAGAPDVLYAQLPASNLLALMLPYAGCQCLIACGVRAAEISSGPLNWLTRLAQHLERRLVLRADLVIANSQAGARFVDQRLTAANMVVINNGVEAPDFAFDAEGRRQQRAAWGLDERTLVVGCVARLDPIKDHVTLLRGFALLRRSQPRACLVCVGSGPEAYAAQLRNLARQLQVDSGVLWIERATELRALYSAFDALCLSSTSEGFPNVLAEGMACGLPCVATDVGDAARIVSATDFLIPTGDPQALSRALAAALIEGRRDGGRRAEKIRTEFSPQRLAENTERALLSALARRRPRASSRSGDIA